MNVKSGISESRLPAERLAGRELSTKINFQVDDGAMLWYDAFKSDPSQTAAVADKG